jgi:hypothetical protein
MAQAQYRRAAKPGGFQPINVGGQSIARMREESARVADGLRTARAAEIQNREAVLAQMKEDARYTERAQAANSKILTQNATNELQQLQSDASVALQNFNNKQATTENVVKSVVGLSQTASKQLAKLEEERFKEDAQRAIAEFDPNSDAYIQHLRGEGQLDAIEELRQGAIDNVYANGGNPLAVAQAREMSSGARYGLDKARANYLWTVVYPEQIQRAKAENPEAFESSAATAGFLVESKRRFIEETGLINLKPEMMADGLTAADTLHQSILTQTRKVEEKNTYQRMDLNQMQILSQDPANFNVNITKAFRTWARNPDNLFAGALTKFEGLATMRNPNGDFMFSMEQLAQAKLRKDGKAFILENPGRFAAMQAKRVESQNTFNRAALTAENLTYQKKEQDVLKFLANNNTQANANYAVQYFRKTFGQVPQSILTFQKSYTGDAIEKAQAIEKLKAIPDGFITQEAVDTLAGLDYNEGKALEARREVQERPYKFELYQKTFDSYKTIANGVTSVGTQKPNTPESVFFTTVLQGTFKRYYDEARESGLEGQPAVNYAKDKVQAMLDDAKTNKDALFYRKVNGPGGVVSFPNLVKGQQGKIDEALLFRANLRKEIGAKGIETVINTQGTIITSQEEAAELSRQVRQPGFILPGKFMIPTTASKDRGHDPMVTFNAQLAAWGEKPIPPPPSLDHVNKNVSPELKALLYNNPSPNRSSRALGSTNVFTPAIVPNNYGPLIEQSAQANGVNPSHIAALAEIESNFNPNAPSYNNSSFGVMQINRDAHPAFFASQNWKDPQANIEYGTRYYKQLLDRYKDPVAAAMAYNAGPGYYDAYLRGEMPDGRKKTEMINHGKKFAKAMYKYGGGGEGALNNPALMRSGSANMQLSASAASYVGMDTSGGPDAGRNACVWALNKVMLSAGISPPWGNSVYVPEVKQVLDKTARRVAGPVPGAIAIMQDNHPTDPFPHIGIVGSDGMIVSNSSARARFDWRGTPQEYEQKYGKANLYYVLN